MQKRTQLAVDPNSDDYRTSTASEYEDESEPVAETPRALPREPRSIRALPDPPAPGAAPAPPAKSASKTASLIEMYRERERQSQSNPIPSSRLPVRQASLQANGKSSPLPSPSPPAADLPEIEEPAEDKVSVEDVQIDMPTRYVHGAPLHNVMEEPEEEEA